MLTAKMPDTRGFNCNGAESQVAERVAALKRKQDDILGRVTELERRCASTSAGTPSASRSFDYLSSNMTSTLVMNCNGAESQVAERVAALQRKQDDILARIAELERRCASNSTVAPFAPMDISPVQRRLAEELAAEGIVNHRFVRAPPEYYDQTLEFRQAVLQAASVHHLCKTIIMENTRVEAREEGIHKYYMVIVQYSAKLHSDKLRQFVQASHNGRLSKR